MSEKEVLLLLNFKGALYKCTQIYENSGAKKLQYLAQVLLLWIWSVIFTHIKKCLKRRSSWNWKIMPPLYPYFLSEQNWMNFSFLWRLVAQLYCCTDELHTSLWTLELENPGSASLSRGLVSAGILTNEELENQSGRFADFTGFPTF